MESAKKKLEPRNRPTPAVVKTVDEFRRVYLPNLSATPRLDTLSPQQVGEFLAEQSLEELRKKLNRK